MPRASKIIPFGFSRSRIGKPYITRGRTGELQVRKDDKNIAGLSSSRGFRTSGVLRKLRRIK
tara:strand:- start:282 stop:467 length:186 start_codon:yes stop_codon:yes gene_type:complete